MRKIKGLRGTGKRYPSTYGGTNRPIVSIDANGFVIRGRDHHHVELLLRLSRNEFKKQPLPIPEGLFNLPFAVRWYYE